MAISVAEIKGRGIAAFHAYTGPLAELFVRDPPFATILWSWLAMAYPFGPFGTV
jgi:hypothetical protein